MVQTHTRDYSPDREMVKIAEPDPDEKREEERNPMLQG